MTGKDTVILEQILQSIRKGVGFPPFFCLEGQKEEGQEQLKIIIA